MILLELYGDKNLKVKNMHKIFVGENNFDSVNIQLMDGTIGDQDVDDCEFSLHVVLPDQSYFEYELEFGEDDIASVPITSDWTGSAQKLKLYVEITADDEVLGSTNRVEIMVEHIVNEAIRLLNRDELIDFFNNVTAGKQNYVNLGTNNNTNVFDNNTDYKTLYAVTHNSVGYIFYSLQHSSIQYRFSGNGIEVRSTSESTWVNLTQNRAEHVSLGTDNNTNVFDNNTDYKKLYSVIHNSVGYLFFKLQGSNIQYRLSGNGIEARSTSESTWVNLTQNRAEHVNLGTNDNTNVFDNNTDYKKLYSVIHNSVGYLFFKLQGSSIQYRFSGNGIEVRSTSESTWTNLTDRDTTPTENSTKLITSGAVFAALAGKLNFVDLGTNETGNVFDNYTSDGTLYKAYYVNTYYYWITLKAGSIPLFQYRFNENGIEIRTYSGNTWSAWNDIAADKLGLYSNTNSTKTLSDLNTYTDSSKDYYVFLAADVLYAGQSTGTGIKIKNVCNGQYIFDEYGNIYFRRYNRFTQTWSSITTIVSNS